jgi:hypothetical protein
MRAILATRCRFGKSGVFSLPSLAPRGMLAFVQSRRRNWLGWYLCVLLAGSYPLVHFYARNYQCFTARQLLYSAGFLVLVATAAYALAALLTRGTLKAMRKTGPIAPDREASAFALGLSLPAAAIYLALSFHPLWQDIQARGWPFAVDVALLLLLCGLIAAAGWKIGWKWISAILALAIGLEAVRWGNSARAKGKIAAHADVPAAARAIYSGIRLQSTPDIYFVVLESYHSPSWLREFYGTDDPPFIQRLEQLGFQIHSNVYANYLATLASLHSTFSMTHHYYAIDTGDDDSIRTRALISGQDYNPVLSILKANGYRVEYLLGNHYLCLPEMAEHAVDVLVPPNNGSLAPLMMLAWPHGAFSENFQMDGYRDLLLERAAIPRGSGPPRFVFVKAGLRHLPRGPHDREAWKRTYRALLEEENEFLSAFCGRLVDHNPDAIVVLMGDHGAWGYAGRWWSKTAETPNEYFRDHGLDPASVARDMTDILLATRTGREAHSTWQVASPINLFRELFAYLSHDRRILDTRAQDASYKTIRSELYRLVLDGQPLASWQKIPVDENGVPLDR